MYRIIEDQIIQDNSSGLNKGFLADEKEGNLNFNIEISDNINKESQLFSIPDAFSEISSPNYTDKNLNESQNNTFKNIEPTSDFFSKEILEKNLEILEKNLGLREMENDYSENFLPFNCYDTNFPQTKTKNSSENDVQNNEYKQKPNFNSIIKISKNRKFFRVDDSKKHFKVAISKFATEELNLLIEKSDLPRKLKKKIHLPNYNMFTSNVRELDNLNFLSFDLKNIFIHGKKEGNLQEDNEKKISNILNYNKDPEKIKEIKDFLFLKYEDIIKKFYKSEKFDEFKKKELTQFFNDGMIKVKNISLLKDNGLLDLFKMTNKKRKKQFFSSKVME